MSQTTETPTERGNLQSAITIFDLIKKYASEHKRATRSVLVSSAFIARVFHKKQDQAGTPDKDQA